jgi:hypothetical protein
MTVNWGGRFRAVHAMHRVTQPFAHEMVGILGVNPDPGHQLGERFFFLLRHLHQDSVRTQPQPPARNGGDHDRRMQL